MGALLRLSPLSRSLIRRKYSQARIVLIGQTATMIIIGLWHGVTGHFVIGASGTRWAVHP
jgi:D-alanyl-lipoteichoic acid acyltransferase DltB (MBOAT superfamily)